MYISSSRRGTVMLSKEKEGESLIKVTLFLATI